MSKTDETTYASQYSLKNIYCDFYASINKNLSSLGYSVKVKTISSDEWIMKILTDTFETKELLKVSTFKEFKNNSPKSPIINLRYQIAKYLLSNDCKSLNTEHINKIKDNIKELFNDILGDIAVREYKKRHKIRKNEEFDDSDADVLKNNLIKAVYKDLTDDIKHSDTIVTGKQLFETEKSKTETEIIEYTKLTWFVIISFFGLECESDSKGDIKLNISTPKSSRRLNDALFKKIIELRLNDLPADVQKKKYILIKYGLDETVFNGYFKAFLDKGVSIFEDTFKDRIGYNELLEYIVLLSESIYQSAKTEEAAKIAQAGLNLAYSERMSIGNDNMLFVMRLQIILIRVYWRQKLSTKQEKQIEESRGLYDLITQNKLFISDNPKEYFNEQKKQYYNDLDPIIHFLQMRGLFFSRIGKTSLALEAYDKELQILLSNSEKSNSVKNQIGVILNNMASLYARIQNYGKMHRYYQLSLDYKGSSNKLKSIAVAYVGVAESLIRIDELDKARCYIEKADKIRTNLYSENKIWLSSLLNCRLFIAIINTLEALKSYPSLNDQYYQAQKLVKQIHNMIDDNNAHGRDNELYTISASLYSIEFMLALISGDMDTKFSNAENFCKLALIDLKNELRDNIENEFCPITINDIVKMNIAAAFCCLKQKSPKIEAAEEYFKEAFYHLEYMKENDSKNNPGICSTTLLETLYNIEHARFLMLQDKNEEAKTNLKIASAHADQLCESDIHNIDEYKDNNLKAFRGLKLTATELIKQCDDRRATNEAYDYTDCFRLEAYLLVVNL